MKSHQTLEIKSQRKLFMLVKSTFVIHET